MTKTTNLVIWYIGEIMATAFNENEIKYIKLKLHEAAQECLGKYGVRKTTIDQLTEISGIAKGSFYKFYPSKEILFFTVIEDYQNSIIEDLIILLKQMDIVTPEKFTDLIFGLFQNLRHSFMMNIIEKREFEYLIRKLPEDLILKHHSFDDLLAKNLFESLSIKKDLDIGVITASLRAVFMTMLYVSEIGEKDFDKALKLLIRVLAQQILEGDSKDE